LEGGTLSAGFRLRALAAHDPKTISGRVAVIKEGTAASVERGDRHADRGAIAIQAEGTEVEFRKVEIGPLPPEEKK
jgi:hypothetical protein